MEYRGQDLSRCGGRTWPVTPASRSRRSVRATVRRGPPRQQTCRACCSKPPGSIDRRLKDSPRAIDYLKGRGLTGEVAVRFGIGYAADDWQPLAKAFADYQDKALETAGLVIAGDNGKRYDRFRDRIMFPIHDGSGRVIGFGGRILDQGEPKYLNSPETPLFSKGRELYGLFQARPAIRTAGKVDRRRRLHGRGRIGAARGRVRRCDAGHRDDADPCAKAAAHDRHRRVLLRRRRSRPPRCLARTREHPARRSPMARPHCSCSCPTARTPTTTSAAAERLRSRTWSARRCHCPTSCCPSWPRATRRVRPKGARRSSTPASHCWRS